MNTPLTNPIDEYTEFMNDSSESREGVMPVLMNGYVDRRGINSAIVKTKSFTRNVAYIAKQHIVGFSYLTFGAMVMLGFSEVVVNIFNKI